MKTHKLWMLAAIATLALTSFSATSCSGTSKNSNRVDCGKYGTIYEIFPYSFADSNGDGIGDLKGITAKLDYIADLGFTGIWITPVQPSPTYHKYDTTDYYGIDPEFGTIDDYKAMVDRAHELDLTVYLDLVLNHCSTQHEWFTESANAHINGNTSDPYYDYYMWSQSSGTYYARYGNSGWYYNHYKDDSQMASLNLQSVIDDNDGPLAKELAHVMEFWLIDCDVDGFRLDAVTSYFDRDDDTIDFLTWLVKTAHSYKDDVYIVGEGHWEGSSYNSKYLSSGIDSFFCFEDSVKGSSQGNILRTLSNESARTLADGINTNLKNTTDLYPNSIPSPFITNHDIGRTIGNIAIRNDIDRWKFSYATLQMYTGSTYHYYGEEIGMRGGGTKYEDYRTAMYWGDGGMCDNPPDAAEVSKDYAYQFGSVKKLKKQKDSSVSFVKKVNNVRNAHPAIFAGSIKRLDPESDNSFSVNEKKYTGDEFDDESLLILMNASATNSYTYTISDYEYSNVDADLSAISGTSVTKNGDTLIIPPLSYCILTK